MGIKTGVFHSLKIGTKNQKFLGNLKSAASFRLIYAILAMTIDLAA